MHSSYRGFLRWLHGLGFADGKVKVWSLQPVLDDEAEQDATVPQLLATLQTDSTAVHCVRFLPVQGAEVLAAGDIDGNVGNARMIDCSSVFVDRGLLVAWSMHLFELVSSDPFFSIGLQVRIWDLGEGPGGN